MARHARHTPTLTGDKKIRALSLDSALFPHVGDALTSLANDWEWVAVGDSVADIIEAAKEAIENWYSDMLIGTVNPWMITPPAGWLLLDGTTYANADYPELSALLPAHLISGSNFTLPDTEAAFPFGVSLEADASTIAGSNVLNLTVGQLPSHSHTYTPPTVGVLVGPPPTIPAGGVGTPIASGTTGSGDDIDKRPLRFGLIYAVYAGRE